MSWLIPRSGLTVDQIRAVELQPTEHRAIIGGPGSGKTQILLHRAKYLADKLGSPRERFIIFVYTNVLKEYIKTALRDLGLPEDNVLTFDNWCGNYYQENINQRLPWNIEERNRDFDAIRKAVITRASNGPKLFDFVLVDEGQDLDEEVFSFLTKVSGHVTVCLDNKQQIYNRGTSESGVLHRLGIRRRNVNLIDAFRVCPYLVETAASLINDEAERVAFINQARQPQTERQTPLIYFARNFEDEKQMLYKMIRERQMKNERIAIILPKNRQVYGFARGLAEVGIEAEVPRRNQTMPSYDFNSYRPKVMSYHSAKGLTFDSIFMPRLVPNSFQNVNSALVERLLFVAITRATTWCYFSTILDNCLPVIEDKIVPLAKTGVVTLLESSERLPAGTDTVLDETAEVDTDFDFL